VSRRLILPAALVGAAIVVWAIADAWDAYPHQHLSDLPVYKDAARAVTEGEIPYRDFAFEYPPLATGLVTLARLVPAPFPAAFTVMMAAYLCAAVAGAVATARALGMGVARQAAAGGVVALAPFLLGDFLASRFDLAVTALLAWTLWAAVTRRFPLAWGLLAVAVALKLVPIVLAPLLVVWHLRHRTGRTVAASAGAAAAGVALTFLPFVALSPGGMWDMFRYHIDRPLQIESLGAGYLLGLHALAGITLRVDSTYGSQNLVGAGPDVIAAVSTALLLVGIAAVLATAIVLLRRIPRPEGAHLFVGACAATLAVTVACGKVLSPQFIVWLLPATLLVSGRFGRAAFAVTVCVMIATQLYFPVRYWDLVSLETPAIVLLVIRDALLVALVALTWPRPQPAPRAIAAPVSGHPPVPQH
jgi:uncharacterized membrane protein